jgi:hypothetical protein
VRGCTLMDAGAVTLSLPAAIAMVTTAAGSALAAALWIVSRIEGVRDEVVRVRERVIRLETSLGVSSAAE